MYAAEIARRGKLPAFNQSMIQIEPSMHHAPTPSNSLEQLHEMLQSPIIELNCEGPPLNLLTIIEILNNSKQCCIIIKTDTSNKKLYRIKALHKTKIMLRKIQEQLRQQDPQLSTRLIGIYPSISCPSCVYELHTDADTYVNNNILPSNDSGFKKTIKCIIEKILGVSPSVGGLGLILEREES